MIEIIRYLNRNDFNRYINKHGAGIFIYFDKLSYCFSAQKTKEYNIPIKIIIPEEKDLGQEVLNFTEVK
ncbi:MAG: hypothetical protein PVJ67_04085 [Candidatus Pacearchaeota archaeon]|jgi:hypothetical protein